jgi:23S rRNA (adenine2030-N6)-methyltransferase
MNYRHAFHAGGFADVVKHAVLARILAHLRAKPARFRVIDTHAGAGLYDLAGPQASRSLEWRSGIERVLTAPIGAPARVLLEPYLAVVNALNADGVLARYPGSPAIVQASLRARDRLVACELEPGEMAALSHNFRSDKRVKALAIDGWTALNAGVPPPERRGLVLIDPPFEEEDDFARLVQGLQNAHRKWATGIYLLWYPVKGRQEPDRLARRLARSRIAKILRAEIAIGAPAVDERLTGCGLIVVNPPWTLAGELDLMLPALAAALSGSKDGAHRLDWIAPEASSTTFPPS